MTLWSKVAFNWVSFPLISGQRIKLDTNLCKILILKEAFPRITDKYKLMNRQGFSLIWLQLNFINVWTKKLWFWYCVNLERWGSSMMCQHEIYLSVWGWCPCNQCQYIKHQQKTSETFRLSGDISTKTYHRLLFKLIQILETLKNEKKKVKSLFNYCAEFFPEKRWEKMGDLTQKM